MGSPRRRRARCAAPSTSTRRASGRCARRVSGRDEKMLMKLVVDAETDKVLGCHILGGDAGEIAQLPAIAVRLGATKAHFDATMALHPTAAEELVPCATNGSRRHRWRVRCGGLRTRSRLSPAAGAGIGRGIARTFAREGAHVVVTDLDADAAGQVAAEIVTANGAARRMRSTSRIRAQVKALMQSDRRTSRQARRVGQQCGRRRTLRFPSSHRRGLGPGLEGQSRRHGALRARSLRAVAASGQGSVINLSSVMADKHTRQMAVYSATKGAVWRCRGASPSNMRPTASA